MDELERHPELAFEKDFLRWMLSDGAGAALLSSKPNDNRLSLEIEWIVQKSYANVLEPCMYAGAENMIMDAFKDGENMSLSSGSNNLFLL